jgi:predicted HAD superfamily Cof-like phosphohydrolase
MAVLHRPCNSSRKDTEVKTTLENLPSAQELDVDEAMHSVLRFHTAFGLVVNERPALPHHDDPEVNQVLSLVAQHLSIMSKHLLEFANNNPDKNLLVIRVHLMTEELGETVEAMAQGNHIKVLDGFADQRVVQDGSVLALGYGGGFMSAHREVMRANMSKLDAEGRPVLSPGGRVIKSDQYTPPVLDDALDECHQGLYFLEEGA